MDYDLADESRLDADRLRKEADRIVFYGEYAVAYQHYPHERDWGPEGRERPVSNLSVWIRTDSHTVTAPRYEQEVSWTDRDDANLDRLAEISSEHRAHDRIQHFMQMVMEEQQ